MKAVVYGAGNIGRGFIGSLFARAGYKVIFIDTAEIIVNELRKKGSYPVRFLSGNSQKEILMEDILVEGVSAVNSVNAEEVTDCIAGADIMATAVGVRALSMIAPVFAGGLKKRFQTNAGPLNIIVCENLIDADLYLAELVKKNLDEQEIKLLKEKVGFVEASIGRMAPIQTPEMQDGNILRICSEKYSFLPVNKDAFVGAIPEIEGLIPFGNFDFYIQRKLFIHNMGHAICAYLGLLLGDSFISDTVARADVLFIAQNAMLESAQALGKKFNVPLQGIIDHVRDLLCRFNNRALKDTCVRVGADIERKLGPQDRFIGAMSCCKEQGVTPAFISIGAAAALFSLLKERGLDQTEKKAAAALGEISRLDANSAEAALVLDMYLEIVQGKNPAELSHTALHLGNKQGVI